MNKKILYYYNVFNVDLFWQVFFSYGTLQNSLDLVMSKQCSNIKQNNSMSSISQKLFHLSTSEKKMLHENIAKHLYSVLLKICISRKIKSTIITYSTCLMPNAEKDILMMDFMSVFYFLFFKKKAFWSVFLKVKKIVSVK